MSFDMCINLVRNIHHDIPKLYPQLDEDDPPRPLGLLDDAIILETAAQVPPPYLIVRRHDDIASPWSGGVPLAYVLGLEYVISEDAVVSEGSEEVRGNVGRIRDIDSHFMGQMLSNPYFRGTSEVEEGLEKDRVAYILARTLELSADLYAPLHENLRGD